ncbi:MAG: helicase [Segetibacter sp.]|nr:helicase [Segetibacter sp.]
MNPDPSNTIFQKAVAFVNQTNRHLFITGKAGTGKTTFLKYIRDNSFKKMAVVAPTGVAAINAGGVTIHSFFQLPFGPFIPTESGFWGQYNGEINNRSSLLKNLRLPAAKKQVIRELDLLIIDEVSMVRADLLDAVDTVMRHIRRQPLLPFGGAQMVYIGDLFQLPPVAKNEEWEILQEYYKSPFFFDANVVNYVPPVYIELKKIYRQKDDAFINILNHIRNNCCTPGDLELLHRHYNPSFSPAKEDNYITLTSHNYRADSINQTELNKLPGKIYTYAAKISGEFYERSYPVEKELQLKQGAQVMFIKNDKGENRKFYNGKIGTVKRIEREKLSVVFPGEQDELELEQETWRNVRYNYNNEKDDLEEEELGTFTQYPLRLAWAITIHKSQGLTFEKAVIDAGASFAPGQVYVSLSRLTGLQGLVLHSKILPNCISTDNRVIEFVQKEMAEDVLQQTLEQEQKVFIRQSLLHSFSFAKIADIVEGNFQEYEHRQIPEKEKCIKWAHQLNEVALNLQDVSEKFTKQLEYLFLSCEADGYNKLHERTNAAAKYFLTELDEKLLSSVKKHLDQVKVRQKVKRYVKDLQELLLILSRKKQQIEQALQLSDALYKAVNVHDLLKMLEQNKKETPLPVAAVGTTTTKGKPEKGESGRMSLEMFKKGKSIADIAAERGLSQGTIEGHLAGFVSTAEVDILDLVDNNTLNELTALLEADEDIGYADLKEKAGNNISYGTIKAVINFHQLTKGKKEFTGP